MRFRRPAFVVAFLFVALTFLSIRSGAPTHHPERALLVMHLLAAVLLGHVAVLVGEQRLLPVRRVLVFLGVMVPAVVVLRTWFLYRESFAHRADEVAIGRDAAERAGPDERVLVQVVDYGYFAVLAGSGRPWQFDLAGEVRPGVLAEPLPEADLARRAREKGARYFVGSNPEVTPDDATILRLRGAWTLYEVKDAAEPHGS